MRVLLPIIFQLFFFFGLAQTQGVVKTGGYLYPSPSVDVTNSIVYVSAGQPVKIFGRLTSHPNFIEVNINDKIEIKHEAYSRAGFAEGAVLVAEWIQHKKGVLTMNDFINL